MRSRVVPARNPSDCIGSRQKQQHSSSSSAVSCVVSGVVSGTVSGAVSGAISGTGSGFDSGFGAGVGASTVEAVRVRARLRGAICHHDGAEEFGEGVIADPKESALLQRTQTGGGRVTVNIRRVCG